jgi:hypothetical protein
MYPAGNEKVLFEKQHAWEWDGLIMFAQAQ